jgi:hypothetical protein
MRRMAILLNAGHVKPICMTWLTKTDAAIEALFTKYTLDYLVDYKEVGRPGAKAPQPSEIDQAENGFYGKFSFGYPRKVGAGLRVGLEMTTPFLQWSYAKLFRPKGSDADLERHRFKDESTFMQDCATNYLLKNFWHNYVHNALQDVHELNYFKFDGDLTTENDFEADHVASLLLVRSYGHPLGTSGHSSNSIRASIHGVLTRNRCNRVFAEREEIRRRYAKKLAAAGKPKTPRELRRDAFAAFPELEMYFRRRIANGLSAKLIEEGYCVTRLGVYSTGRVRMGRAEVFRQGNVVIQLNGLSIDTKMAVYVRDPFSTKSNAPQKQTSQQRRINAIVDMAANTFGADLKARPTLRDFAAKSLEALGARMGGVRL